MINETLLNIQKLQLSILDVDYPILNSIDYEVYKGDHVVLLGGNGSGKSSLIKVINRSLSPTQGHLFFENQLMNRLTSSQFHQAVITLTQDLQQSFFHDLTVLENCLLWALKNQTVTLTLPTKAERTFFESYLKGIYPSLSTKLDSPIKTLSGGEKQLLLLALCLRHPPKLLLLDEHTSALDPVRARETMQRTFEALKTHSITCIMTTHNLEDALNYGNRLLVLKEGSIIFTADHQEKSRLSRADLLNLY